MNKDIAEKKRPNFLKKPRTQHEISQTTIAIVGLGYVGLPLALLLAKTGYNVIGFDINEKHLETLRQAKAAFLSPEENALLKKKSLILSSSHSILKGANIFIVCVPTPVHEDHTPDLEPLKLACLSVGKNLEKGALVIVESTINPGACENVSIPILEKTSKLRVEEDFLFAHCPERINPGDSRYSVENISRVIGGSGPKSLEKALSFYRSIIKAPIKPMMTLKEAEAVKMVENSFRDVNIAFVNELAMSFEKAGIDIVHVIEGASTKPFAFMPHFPGCGVGGHCIPVDPYYLIRYGKENGFKHRFLIAARDINNKMPNYTVDLLEKTLDKNGQALSTSTVALLGLAYKKDIPDVRESPSKVIADELISRGAKVQSFDPFVLGQSTAGTLEEALSGARAVIIATDHSLFLKEVTPTLLKQHNISILIDGRNALSKELFEKEGITYRGIGR